MQNRIRELRKAKGITMKQLGSVLGLAESTISQYETGKRQPDYAALVKLSEYFGVTVGCILGTEKNTPDVSVKRVVKQDINITSEEMDMILKFRRLDERGKSAVLNTLEHELSSLPGDNAASAPKQA